MKHSDYEVVKKECFQKIKCPECGKIIDAISEWKKGMPFWSYVWECPYCKYVITESEWQVMEEKAKITYFKKEQQRCHAIIRNIIHNGKL